MRQRPFFFALLRYLTLLLTFLSCLLVPTIIAAQSYSDDVTFDLTRVPFSRYGSYIAFSHFDGPLGNGLYLKTIHHGVPPEIFRVELVQNGTPAPFREEARPYLLRLVADSGAIEVCLTEPNLLRFEGRGVGLRLTKMPAAAGFALRRDENRWEFNSAAQDIRFMMTALRGTISVQSDWDGTNSRHVVVNLAPSTPQEMFDVAVEEFRSGWHERAYPVPFADAVSRARQEYQQWIANMPTVPQEFQSAANLAAYVDWSAVVMPEGDLTRPAILMSKNWMNSVWSWDHCFNAMALINAHPKLAWDQFMLMVDKQNAEGALPDALTDRSVTWAFSKPPIHGLALAWMLSHSTSITTQLLAEAYEPLANWTEWYFRYRDDDHDGLPQYDHGNDSGWDNSTVFRLGSDNETPDLAAYLVVQMKTLAILAQRLGRTDDAKQWESRREVLLKKLISSYWRTDRFVALHSGNHTPIESDSLLFYLALVLGEDLPEPVRTKMITALKQPGSFLTDHGLATEKLDSPFYESDGYWRGPIWAPSTFMIVEGLDADGERDFANNLRRKFCEMASQQGFAENYDAVTGRALRDPAYTWSASVFLIFAHELAETQP